MVYLLFALLPASRVSTCGLLNLSDCHAMRCNVVRLLRAQSLKYSPAVLVKINYKLNSYLSDENVYLNLCIQRNRKRTR